MEDLSEKEQIDAIKAWWSENGSYVVGGIVAGVLIIFGWNYWQTSTANKEVAASSLYESVMESAGAGNTDNAVASAAELFDAYPDTPYAAQARLAMARLYMDNGRDQDAADVLQPLAESINAGELALVARLRLAKILLYQDNAEAVIELVRDQPESAFTARFNEVLGDAHVALEQWAEAEAAYIASLNDRPEASTVDVSLIQLKLNDLPMLTDDASEIVEDSAMESGEVDTEDTPPEDVADSPETAEAEESADDGNEESGEQ